ncbi:hypothetical protein C0043_20910, partial [Pseudomonas aeruginosa]
MRAARGFSCATWGSFPVCFPLAEGSFLALFPSAGRNAFRIPPLNGRLHARASDTASTHSVPARGLLH